jgi:hypothetical protein
MRDDATIRETLDRFEPPVAEVGDWDRVLADAGQVTSSHPSPRPRGRDGRRSLLALVGVLGLAVMVVVATPAFGLRDAISELGSAPEEQTSAEAAQMRALAEAGPNDIRCSGSGAELACRGVPGGEALELLRSGEVLYGRHIYGDIRNVVDSGVPFLEADELLCTAPDAEGAMKCNPAGEVQPRVAPGVQMLVSYRRYHVTFGPSGNTIGRHGERTVPLESAQD